MFVLIPLFQLMSITCFLLPVRPPLPQLRVVGEVVGADLEGVEDDLDLLPVLGEEQVGAVGGRGVVGGVPGRVEPALLCHPCLFIKLLKSQIHTHL